MDVEGGFEVLLGIWNWIIRDSMTGIVTLLWVCHVGGRQLSEGKRERGDQIKMWIT